MNDRHSPGLPDSAKAETDRQQSRAARPGASAWVSANAGTGKTRVLTNRVQRLLLDGTPPDRLLCLTYTKAAASEMSRRVYDELAQWAIVTPEELAARLTELQGTPPDDAKLALAPTLFARAIETPGGLKVQTIHAFCERLLQRFPLEAGIAPDFTVLDEGRQRTLLSQSVDQVLAQATREPASPLAKALDVAVAYAGDDRFDQLLQSVLGRRETLLGMVRVDHPGDDPFANLDAKLRETLGVDADASDDSLDAAAANALRDGDIERIASVLEGGKVTDTKRAGALRRVTAARSHTGRADALRGALLTAQYQPVKSLMTKALAEEYPDLLALLEAAQANVFEATEQRHVLRVTRATVAIVRLADAIFDAYAQAKMFHAALDYDDLILRTISLLTSRIDAQWVLYKLDNGLHHILVDEAQDTSPPQWRIISQIAAEFFSGAGVSGHTRTLFAVGDEKQSIYGFQGARPEMFSAMGELFERRVRDAGQTFNRVPLTMSFRTVAPVLDAVDTVFATPAARDGIAASDDAIAHLAYRAGQPGLVELWQTEKPDKVDPADPWRPDEERASRAPMERLGERMAGTIARWIETGEKLPSTGRPITAGDVLILVRRRQPFGPAIIRALKKAGVPVAGADRIRITQQIAVMDLMALGAFVLMPGDDLSLACVLKSPLIGLDDDDLLAIGYGRKYSLWRALLRHAGRHEAYREVTARLRRWRARADFAPPFEFFTMVLEREGRRAAMLERLGPEAGDAMDEFLNQALSYDEQYPPSIQGFLEWLRQDGPEIRRDMEQGRDEVRVMTVHGAKGLEARIVFLPDTCASGTPPQGASVVSLPPQSDDIYEQTPLIWVVKGTGKAAGVQLARDHLRTLDDQEYRRLLYVAMTRAQDRLYICGYEGVRKPAAGCWYNLMHDALIEGMTEGRDADDRPVWRMEHIDDGYAPDSAPAAAPGIDIPPLPAWFDRPAPVERVSAIPVAPSRIVPLEPDEMEAALRDAPAPSPLNQPETRRFTRGLLTHALLEHLPGLPEAAREDAAASFVARRGTGLSETVRHEVVGEVLGVLRAPEFADLFGPGSQAEVGLCAHVSDPAGKYLPLRVAGTIDRLVVRDHEVLFIDYKTNRPPPRDIRDVAPAYLTQLAAYRLVLQQLYPDHTLTGALLWTDGGRIMAIPDAQLDAVENLLRAGESAAAEAGGANPSTGGFLDAAGGGSYVVVNAH